MPGIVVREGADSVVVEERVIAALRERWGIDGPLTAYPDGSQARAWRIDADGGPFVARLTGDTMEHLTVGLRMSELLDAAGVNAGKPIRALDGSIAVDMASGRLAVLEHVPGSPPTVDDLDTAELGRLLATVHRAVAGVDLSGAWTVEDVCSYERAGVLDDHPAWVHDFVPRMLDAVAAWAPDREQLLRGDGFGILVEDGATTGMIDWGATRWGSVADDIGCWTVHLGPLFDGYEAVTARFIDAYREVAPLTEREVVAVPMFQGYRLASRPAYVTDPAKLAGIERWVAGWRAVYD
jgi:Ser/Thr protein kinase RdoA (MazF antagonist)